MRAPLTFALVVVAIAIGSACGSTSSETSKSHDPSCPAAVPANGASCASPGRGCEYGSDPNVGCDVLAQCSGGAWAVYHPSGQICDASDAGNSPSCAADFTGVTEGSACNVDAVCTYREARCACALPPCVGACQASLDGGTGPRAWRCDVPTPSNGCPIPRPRIGDACATANELCDYGGCTGNVVMQCESGYWEVAPSMCAE